MFCDLEFILNFVVFDLELCLFGLVLVEVALGDIEVSLEFVVKLCDLLVRLDLDLVGVVLIDDFLDVVSFPI